jgi:predicted Zn-dependent protease
MLRRSAAILLLILVAACATTGPGGRRSLILVPTAQEVALGREAAQQVESEERILEDPEVQAYVQRVGRRIVEVCDRADLDYTFRVLDSDQVNAFALPGGFIYVYTGLMKRLQNEAQLAAVLAHEISHVVGRHGVKRLQEILGYQLLATVVFGSEGNETARQIADVAVTLALQGYSRKQESEADAFGLIYMNRAGYDPEGMVETLEVLRALDPSGGGFFENLLGDHPPPEKRIEAIRRQMDGLEGPRGTERGEVAYRAILRRLP